MPALKVDPGHGGEDGGAVAPDGTAEAELNLSISRGRQRQDRDDGIRKVYIMKNVSCTAVMTECGFLSNPGDLALLKSDNHQKRLASAPAAAYLSTCLLTEAG